MKNYYCDIYLISIARADSIGINNLLIISSVTSSLQLNKKLWIDARAPARPSKIN